MQHEKTRRLDIALVECGLVATRSRARDLIERNFVSVNGFIVRKPSFGVAQSAVLALADTAPSYVSRGAEKLIAGLDHFDLAVTGRVALDVGASTGGFTQVLLRRGAVRVVAVDVGQGQLHPSLWRNSDVLNLEKTDVRDLSVDVIGGPANAVVVDVSFVSLLKVLPSVLALTSDDSWLVALIKPQFEVGRERIGKGGIVNDEAARQDCIMQIERWFEAQEGWRVLGVTGSPILGGSGNHEYLIGAVRNG